MRTQFLLTAFLLFAASGARAEFSLVCDEQAELEDVLRTDQARGFQDASLKLRAYTELLDERHEGACEVSRVPRPSRVGQVVGRYEGIEFLPGELHDVVIVEVHTGGRVLFGTINRYVSEKKPETPT